MTNLEVIPVIINGKSYATALYNGVQRFVPNEAVDFLVESVIKSGISYNELGHKVILGEIPLQDYIEFLTLCNGSLGHFMDSLSSTIDMNPDFFSGSFEELVQIENPLWSE